MDLNDRRLSHVCAILSFAALAGCGSDAPPGPVTPGLNVVSARTVADTVQSQRVPDLVLRVIAPSGGSASGVAIRVESVAPASDRSPGVLVCTVQQAQCENSPTPFGFIAVTDRGGSAVVRVRPQPIAGTFWVRLTVPEFGFRDSVRYDIAPGNATGVVNSTADTVVAIGQTIRLSGRTVDTYGNLRADTTTLEAASGAVTVVAGSTVVQGAAFGSQTVYTQFRGLRDSTRIRVVPPGRLLLWASFQQVVSLANTDGSGLRVLLPNVTGSLGAFPRFSATGASIVLHRGSNLVIADTLGTVLREIGPVGGFESILVSRILADGTVLVVGRQTGVSIFDFGLNYRLWRVGSDGALTSLFSLPQLMPFSGTDALYGGADISPDGSRLAYTVRRREGGVEAFVVDIASGVTRALGPGTYAPRWSPTGDRIAFLFGYPDLNGGTLFVAAPDGSQLTPVGSARFVPGLGWSPDGQYLIGRVTARGGLAVVRVSDGETVPLLIPSARVNVFEDYLQPDWR